MSGGWFRLHRKIIESQVFADPNALVVWIYILARAAHKDVTVFMSVGHGVSKPVNLKRGQCVIGRLKGASACKMAPSTFRNALSRLGQMGMIEKQDKHQDKHWTVITITNWDTYQFDQLQEGQASGQAQDKHRTHTRSNKNLEEEKPFLVPPADSAPEQPHPPKRRFLTQPEYEATIDGFNPDEEMVKRLESLFPGIRIEIELAKWREYWRGNKKRALNLRSSFTNWCDKAFRMGFRYAIQGTPILSNSQVSQNKAKSESQLFMETLIQDVGVERVKKH